MKVAVLADIHGNFPVLNAVLAEVEDECVNQILIAGDILGGPYPVEVIKILHDLKACMIKGNFEDYILIINSNPSDSNWYLSKQFAPTREVMLSFRTDKKGNPIEFASIEFTLLRKEYIKSF